MNQSQPSEEIDAGHVLAAISRQGFEGKPGDTLRVSVREYQGRPFCELRLWFTGRDGQLRPSAKGVTVRRHEIEQVIGALQAARAELGAGEPQQARRGAPQPERQRRPESNWGDRRAGRPAPLAPDPDFGNGAPADEGDLF